MKILFINNEPCGDHTKLDKFSRSFLPYYLHNRINLLGLGKKDFLKFLFHYYRFKPDLILSDWIPAGTIPVFLKKIGLIKCPIIFRWEDYYAETMTNYPYFLVNFLEKFTVKNADYIITVFKTLYDKSKEMKKEVFLLPVGITPSKNKKTKLNLDKIKSKKSNLKVIYLGEINNPHKKVDLIIESVKGLECDLFLFGEEPEENLKNLINGHKNIHPMGWADRDEIQSILSQADILITAANHDMSAKLVDYIKARKPILALNNRPAKSFIHKETAYLTNDFKEGLKELISDKNLRKKLEKGIKSLKTYTWEEVTNIHLNLYEKILNGEKNLEEFRQSYYHVDYANFPLKKGDSE